MSIYNNQQYTRISDKGLGNPQVTTAQKAESRIYSIPVLGSIVAAFVALAHFVMDLFSRKKPMTERDIEKGISNEQAQFVTQKAETTAEEVLSNKELPTPLEKKPSKEEIKRQERIKLSETSQSYIKDIEKITRSIEKLELNEDGYKIFMKLKDTQKYWKQLNLQAAEEGCATDDLNLYGPLNRLDDLIATKEQDFVDVKTEIQSKKAQAAAQKEDAEKAKAEEIARKTKEEQDKQQALATLKATRDGIQTLEDLVENKPVESKPAPIKKDSKKEINRNMEAISNLIAKADQLNNGIETNKKGKAVKLNKKEKAELRETINDLSSKFHVAKRNLQESGVSDEILEPLEGFRKIITEMENKL